MQCSCCTNESRSHPSGVVNSGRRHGPPELQRSIQTLLWLSARSSTDSSDILVYVCICKCMVCIRLGVSVRTCVGLFYLHAYKCSCIFPVDVYVHMYICLTHMCIRMCTVIILYTYAYVCVFQYVYTDSIKHRTTSVRHQVSAALFG